MFTDVIKHLPSPLHALSHLIFAITLWTKYFLSLYKDMKKVRFEEVKQKPEVKQQIRGDTRCSACTVIWLYRPRPEALLYCLLLQAQLSLLLLRLFNCIKKLIPSSLTKKDILRIKIKIFPGKLDFLSEKLTKFRPQS